MTHKIVFSPKALDDLRQIYVYVADQANPLRAKEYTDRIKIACKNLSIFPLRGTERDSPRPGIRIMGFEKRATIVFYIESKTVFIDRILYGGRSLEKAFDEDE